MKIFKELWRYWKWLCVALCSTCVVLLLLTAAITLFKGSSPSKKEISHCIDNGGTWDEGEGVCKTAA